MIKGPRNIIDLGSAFAGSASGTVGNSLAPGLTAENEYTGPKTPGM